MRTATRTPRTAILFALLGVTACFPMVPGTAAERGPAELSFIHLNQDDGLSENTVGAIVEDRLGFMWFATADGLNRYDGASIAVYQNNPEDARSLSDNSVKSLLEDRDGNLWVGCDKGLNRYDRNADAFIRFQHDESDPRSISQNSIPAICEDSQGALWFGGNGGIDRFDKATETFTKYSITEFIPEQRTGCRLCAGDHGRPTGISLAGHGRKRPVSLRSAEW